MQFRHLLCLAALVIITAGGIFVPVRAQDGGTLSEEEQVLVQRVLDAGEQYDTLASYVEVSNFSQTQGVTIRLGDQFRTVESTSSWARHASIIREQDGRNISATITANKENSQTTPDGKSMISEFALSIDARMVGGKLYVLAVYPESVTQSDELPVLPDGWTEIANLDEWSVFQAVGLDDLIEDSSILDNPELFKSAVTSAAAEPMTLDDGSPADLITLLIGWEGIKAIYLDEIDPSDEAATKLMSYIGEESSATLELIITADGIPHQSRSTITLRMPNIDPALVGITQELPEEATVDYTLHNVEDSIFGQINEPLEPATVPDELAG